MAFKRKPVYKKRRATKRVKRTPTKRIARVVRRVIARTAETKYKEFALENQQLFHNGGTIIPAQYTYQQASNMLTLAQGQDVNGRIGDEVYAIGLSIRLWLSQKLDRPNVAWRIVVYSYPYDVGDATGAIDLFDSTVGFGFNRLLNAINKERYRVLYDKTLSPLSGDYSLEVSSTQRERSRMHNIWIPLKRKIQYRPNSVNPKNDRDRLGLALIPYDAFGTLTTDNIASFAIYNRYFYKDM